MKRHLRALNGDQTYYRMFDSHDVVYRYNPDKGKQDVFVGEILEEDTGDSLAKYRILKNPLTDLRIKMNAQFFTTAIDPETYTFEVAPDTVRRV